MKLFCSNYWQNPQITAAVHYFQKQPPACYFFTKKLQHRCFPAKFAKCLRIPILKNICERLLLYLHYNSSSFSLLSLSLPSEAAVRRWSTKYVFSDIGFKGYPDSCSPVRVGVSVKVGIVLGLGGNQTIAPEEKCPLVRVRVWVSVSFWAGGQFSSAAIVLEPI